MRGLLSLREVRFLNHNFTAFASRLVPWGMIRRSRVLTLESCDLILKLQNLILVMLVCLLDIF